MKVTNDQIAFRLAKVLLAYYGEISVAAIRAMPFLTEPSESEAIVKGLLHTFDAEVYQRKITSYPVPSWEEIIRLRGTDTA